LKGHSGALRAAAFSPDGKNLVTAGRDSSIRSWDLSSIEKGSSSVFRIPDVIRTIAFLGDGRQIVAAGNSGKVFLWNIREQNSSVLLEHAARATSLAVHPDGSVLCGFSDGTIYQFTNGKSSEIKGASSAVDKIVISPRGNLFAAALADQTIRIFQFRDPDQKPILLKDQHSKSRALIFDKSDRLLATCANDFSLRSWETKSAEMRARLCDKLKRNLTRQEWTTFVGPDIEYRKTCPGL